MFASSAQVTVPHSAFWADLLNITAISTHWANVSRHKLFLLCYNQAFSTAALQFPEFLLPFRAWESRWTLQGDLGGGHEIQAVRAEVGKHIPEVDKPCTRRVCRAPADLEPLEWRGPGQGTADVWNLGCYGVVFSTRAGTQLPANDSHGNPVQCRAEQGTLQEKSIAERPAALSHLKGETGRQQRQRPCRELHSQMSSPQFPHQP